MYGERRDLIPMAQPFKIGGPLAGASPSPETPAAAVAIDGPAGAGKSTVSRALAKRLGFFLLDTGAIYRCVALAAKRAAVAWSDGAKLGELARGLPVRFEADRVLIGDEDVSQAIRTPEMSQGASTVSAHPPVRAALLELQRRIARQGGCVVEGRDIGTVVLPWAPVKFFLTASPEVRARRRYEELVKKGEKVDYDSTLRELRERDQRDSSREASPLKQAEDAILVDTSNMAFEDVVSGLESVVRKKIFP
jgi:cytidylate kinase